MSTKEKGFIFDVDGTLIRTDISYAEEAVRNVLAETGDGIYNKEVVPYFWWGGNGILRGEVLKQEFHVKDVKRFWDAWNRFVSDFEYAAKFKSAYEDVEESIKSLKSKGLLLAIVTDPPRFAAEPHIKRFLPYHHFNPILSLSGTPGLNPKPDPKGLLLCAEQMGLSSEEVSYIGDSTNDILAANKAGMGSIRINRGEHEVYVQPQREIKSLYELLT